MLKDLNLKHLYYFWVIAESGSIARASDQLDLAPQTLSSQLSAFEARTGALFFRKGRGLKLTPLGEQLRHYASQIFTGMIFSSKFEIFLFLFSTFMQFF